MISRIQAVVVMMMVAPTVAVAQSNHQRASCSLECMKQIAAAYGGARVQLGSTATQDVLNPDQFISDTVLATPAGVGVRLSLLGTPGLAFLFLETQGEVLRGGGFPDPQARQIWEAIGRSRPRADILLRVREFARLVDPAVNDTVVYPTTDSHASVAVAWASQRQVAWPRRDSVVVRPDGSVHARVVMLSRHFGEFQCWYPVEVRLEISKGDTLTGWAARTGSCVTVEK